MAEEFIHTVGRRKRAIARVRLFSTGEGEITVNKRNLEDYFPREVLRSKVLRPMMLTEKLKGIKVKATLKGGGISAQAGALAHGISRALEKMDASLRGVLKKDGLLTRDPREVERKKPGQKKARKRFQFSKR